jgi:asparagine synthase (glutamine-hydrolysing)
MAAGHNSRPPEEDQSTVCGIAGLIPADPQAVPDRRRLERMIGALRHRGPDGFGYHLAPGVGLAHARLAIIDLLTGDQPIGSDDGAVQLIFNGEIFNYVELRAELQQGGARFRTASDTETILRAYEQYGLGFLEHLNGQFAIALWDGRRRRLVLARDRAGIRPLVYALTPDGLAFASEAKALFAGQCVQPRIDLLGLAEVATFWGCLAPRTAFEQVQALPPGCLAVYQDGALRVSRYWDWSFEPDAALAAAGSDAAAEELQTLLRDAVRLQLRADVPVGAYLSGGLDSSAVAAAAIRESGADLRTFSIAFADREFDEREHQQHMTAFLQTRHTAIEVASVRLGEALPRALWHIEMPLVRTAGIALMLLADSVRDAGIRVVLTGEGADEVFAGYDIFKEAKIRRFWARAPHSTCRPALLGRLYGYLGNSPTRAGGLSNAWFAQGLDAPEDPWFAHRLRWQTTQRALRLLSADARQAIDRQHPLGRLVERAPRPHDQWAALARDQYVEATTLLPGYLLHAQGDRVAMAASVEGRVPFLDHRLIEFAGRLPDHWKLRGLQEKSLLRRAVRDWLPADVARRPKQPYRAPDAASFFHEGRPLEYVAELLSPARVRDAGIFDPEAVRRLFEKCRGGAAIGFGDNMSFMIALTTQLLHDQYVRRPVAGWTG